MLNSLITGKDSTVTKEPCWDCCTNAPHGVRLMCGLYNKNQASDIAIYKTVLTFLFNSLPWKSKLLSTLAFLIPLHLCFAHRHETAESSDKFVCYKYYNQHLAKAAVSHQLISWTLSLPHTLELPSKCSVAILRCWSAFPHLQ